MKPIIQPTKEFEELAKKVKVIPNRLPDPIILLDDNIPLHAARLVLLINIAGRPLKKPSIDGRTKLAKLDFFVRYPIFLEKASTLLLSKDQSAQVIQMIHSKNTVEATMIRYKYGPWDEKYYIVIAYLSSKSLIQIDGIAGVDRYSLTSKGEKLANDLKSTEEFQDLCKRCEIVGDLFGDYLGTEIKNFIYRHFPEIVRTTYKKPILPNFVESDAQQEESDE